MCYNYVNTTITLFREKHDSVVVLCMTGSARHGTCHSCVEDYKLFELVHYFRLGSPNFYRLRPLQAPCTFEVESLDRLHPLQCNMYIRVECLDRLRPLQCNIYTRVRCLDRLHPLQCNMYMRVKCLDRLHPLQCNMYIRVKCLDR